MLYVVEILDKKYVKFGFTGGAISERIAQLQTGCPFEIKEVLTLDGSLLEEQQLHDALRRAAARCGLLIPPNEWYPGRNRLLQGFIAHLRSGAKAALTYSRLYLQDEEEKPVVGWGREGSKAQQHRVDLRFKKHPEADPYYESVFRPKWRPPTQQEIERGRHARKMRDKSREAAS